MSISTNEILVYAIKGIKTEIEEVRLTENASVRDFEMDRLGQLLKELRAMRDLGNQWCAQIELKGDSILVTPVDMSYKGV